MGDLELAIRAVVRDCLGVAGGEELLVVCDPETRELAGRLREEGEAAGADAVLALMEKRATDGTEPPAAIAAAMSAAQTVLAPTSRSLSHTAARKAASERGVRIATLPGVTADMLARVMSADMEELRRRCHAIADALTDATEALVTCANGSDLRLPLGGRAAIADTGDLRHDGAFGNLPCGEGFIAPVEGGAEGTLVVNGSIAAIGRVTEPVALTVEGGHLQSASGEQGERLLDLLKAHGPDGTNVAELGIGANERATLTGLVLEDEKILGSVHVAFGASAGIGGAVQVPIHLDCVVTGPSVELDGRQIVREGELLV